MPLEVVFGPPDGRPRPGTPAGLCPRVDMSTCEMLRPAPLGAVSRGAAFALAANATTLVPMTLISAARHNIRMSHPRRAQHSTPLPALEKASRNRGGRAYGDTC